MEATRLPGVVILELPTLALGNVYDADDELPWLEVVVCVDGVVVLSEVLVGPVHEFNALLTLAGP